jgi:hypothetical protein
MRFTFPFLIFAHHPPFQAGAGSATLSMAYAAYRFGEMCLAAMEGRPVKLCAYVESALLPDVPYFASPLVLGPNGIAGTRKRIRSSSRCSCSPLIHAAFAFFSSL